MESQLIPHLFRSEYSKIVAVLGNSFELRQLEIAEDIASDTFLKATEVWGIKGVPENPTAWLYTVAKNKAKDYFKHNTIFEGKIKTVIMPDETIAESSFEFDDQHISDSQLAMIFAVCDPSNPPESQICLALKVLCGFSVEEIAGAFLVKTETIKKRLHRARTNLRSGHFLLKTLSEAQITTRLSTVLKTLYLLFNEGYFSKTVNQLIRKDLCAEALRLTFILSQNLLTNTPQTSALLSLMCFQSSRLDARTNHTGKAILFEEQDRSLWNLELIERGNHYLSIACTGDMLSKYHLEAAIAHWHSAPLNDHKWQHILELYNKLILIEYSPITALNRTFALAKVYGNEQAIQEAQKLKLEGDSTYHSLLGYLFAKVNPIKAISHYQKAIALIKSPAEKQTLNNEIEKLLFYPTSNCNPLKYL